VGVSPTGDFWFSVGVSPTETGIFPHWNFFSAAAGQLSSCHRSGFCIFDRFDVLPIVRWLAVICPLVRQPKFVRRSVLCIAGAAMFGDFGKSKRRDFAHGRRDRMSVNAVFLELRESHRQFAVVAPGMMSQLDLKSIEQAMARKT